MPDVPTQAAATPRAGVGSVALDRELAALPQSSVFAALHSAGALVAVTRGPEHVVSWRNAAAAAALQGGAEHRPAREVHSALPDTVVEALDRVFATGAPETLAWVPLQARDGHAVLALDASVSRLDDVAGRPWGLLIVAVDASQRLATDRANSRSALLARAAEVVAVEYDPDRALQALADLLVPDFADVVGAYLTDEALLDRVRSTLAGGPAVAREFPGAIARRAAIATALPASTLGTPETVTSPALTPPPTVELRSSRDPLVRVLLTNTPVVESAITPEQVAGWTSDETAARWMVEAGAHSLMAVPLVVNGRATGVISALAVGSRPAFDGSDLAVLVELAARAANTVSHAAAYRAQRRAALTLQRSLLPRRPAAIPGLEVATRYVAGAVGVEVGGDWWDVIDLGAGRAGLGIGDVAGRGIAAAAVMGQLRTALRTAAHADLPPADAMRLLDGLLADLTLADETYHPRDATEPAPIRFATALYATYEPHDGRLHLANAGHLPPMLVDAHGGVRLIEHGGSPLGTGAREVSDLSILFDIGSTLVLYTDGLVEDRGTDIDDGLDRLRSSLARRLPGADDLEAVADGVLGDLGRLDGHDDDVALLLVRINASARPIDSFATSVTTVAEVPTVRRDAVAVLRRAGASAQSDVVGLAVTELVANALRHVGSRVEVHVDISTDRIVVEVYDIGGRLPRQQHAGPDDEHGRGLAVLDALATRWGVRLVRDGKATWAEFARGRP